MNAPVTTAAQVRAQSDAKLVECQDALAALPEAERTAHLELQTKWWAAQSAAQEAYRAHRKALDTYRQRGLMDDVMATRLLMESKAILSLVAWYAYEESCARVFAAVRA